MKEPGLQVRRHPRLAREDSLEPQAWGGPANRLAEVVALAVRCLDRIGKRDCHRLSGPDSWRPRSLLILAEWCAALRLGSAAQRLSGLVAVSRERIRTRY